MRKLSNYFSALRYMEMQGKCLFPSASVTHKPVCCLKGHMTAPSVANQLGSALVQLMQAIAGASAGQAVLAPE